LVLSLGYLNIHPEIYRGIPRNFGASNDATFVSIDWNEDKEEDPPLEYISDSFKGISVLTEIVEVTSFWDLWNAPSSRVEYEWTYKVKNLTDTTLDISVTYQLQDRNKKTITRSASSEAAEPGETIELNESGQLDYSEAQRVRNSGWSIGNRVVP
jgi:hypothetical protein